MARFVFKLEAVLEQRVQVERQRQGELADVQRTMQRLQAQISAAEKAQREACVLARGEVDARMLIAQARFAATMRHKMVILRERLAAAQKDEAVAQAALIEAARGRKVMEKLREKQQANWLQEQQKREERALEDAASRLREMEPRA